MKKIVVALPLVALVAACGGSGSGGGATQQLKVVGSSTVYPFTTAVAEEFQRANQGVSVIVESTGTGAGIKLFCGGVGEKFPDMVNASRPLKASEYADCAKAGVKNVIELPVGIDGLTLIQAKGQPALNLTVAQIYKALAANPFGKPQTAQTWKDIDPSLPATKIRVLGPPPTSGTRDSLAELILEKGCDSDPAMKELKKSDSDAHKATCTKIREDGVYVEAGENDNLLVQKVSADPGALGVLGYSFLEENLDKVTPVSIAGVAPTESTISDLSYPGSRKLFVYVKGEHMAAKPAIKTFIEAYSKAWGKGGMLAKRGLVPLHDADAAAATTQATALKPVDPATLK
ncbi:substrate-binding domain-containing protein [Sphingomonas edaphi]|jgi:phosphate transport system substrate-binding protein|uniref:Phosphate ABC transporter substrate-binding protein n=1 Tax=Sphingomonas edaphi TaxID=2315689 RepID=A0A418Q2V8_9SPHN|nr:substrate-binding domain-containing protein [Sphingomonas edaphi]RIX32174.1 phosphate ABC transporter substrate-binding protein [Sphingomonas edaphi]